MASFWGELRRRNVFRVGIAYLAAVWVLIEVVDTVVPIVDGPIWIPQVVVFSAALGFPLALMLAWFYELTPEGVKATADVEQLQPASFMGRKLDFAIIGLLVLAVGFLLVRTPNDLPPVLANSVAVLPFENLSPDADDAYFAVGLHEEILTQLAKLNSLSVISRTSVLRYENTDLPIPDIARELNVGAVMEGTVRYANGQVRITAQLIDANTDEHLWANTYQREFADVFEIESDIALNIAHALEIVLSPAEQDSLERQPTTSPAAYDLYLRAISMLWAATDRAAAISLLTRATTLDPEFALAYARIARSSAGSLVQTFGNPAAELGERERLEAQAREFASQALLLDENMGAAHAALAMIDQVYWRWDEAEQAYERARAVAPNDPAVLRDLARLRSFQGTHGEAIRLMRRVVELEPTAGSYYILASVLAHAGNPEAALVPARKAVEVAPGSPVPHLWLARIGSALGRNAEVAEHLRIAERLLADAVAPVGLASLAFTYSLIGDQEAVSRILSRLDAATHDRNFDAGSWVLGHLAEGDADAAYASLQTVVSRVKNNEPDAGYYGLMVVKSNAQRHPVLDTTRFVELRSQIGGSN